MFPYYGGKARMAPLICDMLDYEHTDIFVTPFGGACRVLLNKPRHNGLEIYNDLSLGLCTFVKLMSDPATAHELIDRIYETEYSQVQFDWALNYRNSVDDNLIKQTLKEWNQFLKQLLIKNLVIDNSVEPGEWRRIVCNPVDAMKKCNMSLDETHEANRLLNNCKVARDAMRQEEHLDMPDNWVEIDDMDLAVATYVVYMQSRDAMGQSWSNSKFKTQEQYYKQMARLYDVADRLQGVEVYNINAMQFFRHYYDEGFLDSLDSASDDEIKNGYRLMNKWLTNPRVIMCCDPSYISPEDEAKIIQKRKQGKVNKQPKNLGTPYKASFTYEDHEAFLKAICHAQCRVIVSNYDLILYNNYLNSDNGWKRIEFETKTSVGGKQDNRRTEVLWYNY